MAQRLDTVTCMPGACGRPVILTILFVSLFACSLASSLHQQQQQQRASAWRRSVLKRAASEPGLLDRYLEPLYERPSVYVAPGQRQQQQHQHQLQLQQTSGDSADDDDDDEQFLRQLKVAAEYLDEKLAARQREQQQRALLAKLGRSWSSSSSSSSSSGAAREGPAYSLGDSYPETGANSGQEGGVVVVAPYVDFNGSPSSSEQFYDSTFRSSPLESPNYRLLDDANDASVRKQQASEQQTYDNYKQLLQSLFASDRAQPTTQGDEQAAAAAAKRESESPNLAEQIQIKEPAGRGKLTTTTLVEEDDDEMGDSNSSSNTTESASYRANETTTNNNNNNNNNNRQAVSTAYGKVVYKQQNNTISATDGADTSASSSSSSSGVFGRMYAQLSRYLPFMSQISILRNPQLLDDKTNEANKLVTATAINRQAAIKGQGDDAHNQDERHHKDYKLTVGPVGGGPAKNQDEGNQNESRNQEELHAKPSISVSLAHNKEASTTRSEGNQNSNFKNDDDDDNQTQAQQREPDDNENHLLKVRVSAIKEAGKQDKQDKSEGESQQAPAIGAKSGDAKRVVVDSSVQGLTKNKDNNDAAEISQLDMAEMLPVIVKHPQYSHLIRQPAQETDLDQGVGAASLLGKYIYAPTQHYYLNSAALPASGSVATAATAATADHQHQHNHQFQAAGARHFRPGDQVYGSYGLGADTPMRAAYAFQKDPSIIVDGPNSSLNPTNLNLNSNNLANKTNDLYFLVMVGAFCVMAMAVVLAAGAFAYRVQQSRKSSQETDYPTYGVVGPNNISGKCGGASAFTMGGYFMGPPGGAGGAASKSGSAKHLADLYGHHQANNAGSIATSRRDANGGSDSGLNSLGRSSHSGNAPGRKAASSSASSLNNGVDQQTTSGRTVPGASFMSAANQDAARMYHYQHQKQQMIISDRNSTAGGRHTSASDLDSEEEEENDDGSYTVYECPGLASAHEMEIKNPLFNDDQTP